MIRIALISLILAPVTAQAQVKPAVAPAAGGVCASLAKDYDDASKDLAANYAAGVGDNSAPRATLREMEDSNTLAQARITLDLMRDHRCPMPKSAPDRVFYLNDALTCATDRLKSGGSAQPPSCNRAIWKRLGA